MGRFISEDSDEGDSEDSLSLNLYTYCAGNPITYTDPSGHSYNPKYEYRDYTPTQSTPTPKPKLNYESLTIEEKIMIGTVYGEAASCGEDSWEAVANVIMNRVGFGEWKKYDTVTEIIQHTGFDAYTQKKLHKVYPKKYHTIPTWVNKKLQELNVKGVDKRDFRFYRYKKKKC